MKRSLLTVAVCVMTIVALPAQTTDFDDFQGAFDTFASEVAGALPTNALIGLNWSDAYIGQLLDFPPNVGVGGTFGVSTLPYEAIKPVLEIIGAENSISGDPDLEFITDLGFPIPAAVAEARIGGIILPFDVGLKFASIPRESAPFLPESVGLDYLSVGADFRYALLKGNVLLPKISVGASYNYLKGSVSVDGLTGGNIQIQQFEAPNVNNPQNTDRYTISLTDPAVTFDWKTSVIEAKAQVSKKILFLTPYVGAGLSTAFSQVGGGLSSQVTVSGDDSGPVDPEELAAVLGEDAPDISDQGFFVNAETPNSVGMRVYGGLSVNLLFLYIDVTGMYNLLGGNWGASVGARIQL